MQTEIVYVITESCFIENQDPIIVFVSLDKKKRDKLLKQLKKATHEDIYAYEAEEYELEKVPGHWANVWGIV